MGRAPMPALFIGAADQDGSGSVHQGVIGNVVSPGSVIIVVGVILKAAEADHVQVGIAGPVDFWEVREATLR